jgi:hypothetical protein
VNLLLRPIGQFNVLLSSEPKKPWGKPTGF